MFKRIIIVTIFFLGLTACGPSNDAYFEKAEKIITAQVKSSLVFDNMTIVVSDKTVCGRYQKDAGGNKIPFIVYKDGKSIVDEEAESKFYRECGSSSSGILKNDAVEMCKKRLISNAERRGDADPSRAERDMDECMAGFGFRK